MYKNTMTIMRFFMVDCDAVTNILISETLASKESFGVIVTPTP
jgi:hypothetical protein